MTGRHDSGGDGGFVDRVFSLLGWLVVAGVLIAGFFMAGDGIDALVKRVQASDGFVYDAADYVRPDRPVGLPAGTVFKWDFDQAGGVSASDWDVRYCNKHCSRSAYHPDYKSSRWTFLLILADTGFRSFGSPDVADSVAMQLWQLGLDEYPLVIVQAGRPSYGDTEVYTDVFGQKCSPAFRKQEVVDGAARMVKHGCFDYMVHLDSVWGDANYERLNEWLLGLLGEPVVNELNGRRAAAGLPLFVAVDSEGIARLAVDAQFAEQVGVALIDYLNLYGSYFKGGAKLGSVDVKMCGDRKVCLYDASAGFADELWSRGDVGPVRTQGISLAGPSQVEDRFMRLDALRAEAQAIPGEVVSKLKLNSGEKE